MDVEPLPGTIEWSNKYRVAVLLVRLFGTPTDDPDMTDNRPTDLSDQYVAIWQGPNYQCPALYEQWLRQATAWAIRNKRNPDDVGAHCGIMDGDEYDLRYVGPPYKLEKE